MEVMQAGVKEEEDFTSGLDELLSQAGISTEEEPTPIAEPVMQETPMQEVQDPSQLDDPTAGLDSLIEEYATPVMQTGDETDFLQGVSGNQSVQENAERSQSYLAGYYRNKYRDVFDDEGNISDLELAKEYGIIRAQPRAAVPISDEEDISGVKLITPHISTSYLSDGQNDYVYNSPVDAIKQAIREGRSNMSRRELVAFENQINEDTIADAAVKANMSREDYIENVVIPEMDDGFIKTIFEYTGSIGFDSLMGVATGINYGVGATIDGATSVFQQTRALDPEWWDKNIGMKPETAAVRFVEDLGGLLEVGEAAPMGTLPKAFQHLGGKTAKEISKDIEKTIKKQKDIRAKMEDNALLNAPKASFAASEALREAEKRAREVAENNKELSEQLIREFEDATGKTVSRTTKDGRLVIDDDLVRQAGLDTMRDTSQLNLEDQTQLALSGESLLDPILKPEKFDGLVAIASELKKAHPDLFKGKRPLIDQLFQAVVATKDKQELISSTDLLDTLNKYGVSFEDFTLMVVGSGSQAGKILNKLSQIKRSRPLNAIEQEAEKRAQEQAGSIRQLGMRIENIRRGGMVSQLGTAARNVQSTMVRAPLEALGNVMDTALYNYSTEGAGKAMSSLVSKENWSKSFKGLEYIFDATKHQDVKGYTDLLLNNDLFRDQYKLLFDNVNEIKRATGRGSGGVLDVVLSEAEDAVEVLNTVNRWQDFVTRRGIFFGELERLVKREYGVELVEELNKGKLRDFMNDASNVRPEGARSFVDLIAESTDKALDVTYAKQPDVPIFREMSSFIVRNGLTTVTPFPRFMFNSMELIGNYGAGASIPLTKKLASIVSGGKVGGGPLTKDDRTRIQRNLLGWAAISAAYMYRTSDEAPADYKMVPVSEEAQTDISPQFPVRQLMYLGEAGKKIIEGTFDNWFDPSEFAETFVGANLRSGVGQSIFSDLVSFIEDSDATASERGGKLLGGMVGEYLSSWFVPLSQVIDLQRTTGVRGMEFKDVREDPQLTFESGFEAGFSRPFDQRGFGLSPEEEAELPQRESIYYDDKRRIMPASKFLGASLMSRPNKDGEYLAKLGFNEYELGSKSVIPSVQRAENKNLKLYIPSIVEVAKTLEENEREKYESMPNEYKEKYTVEKHVAAKLRPFIKDSFTKKKAEFRMAAGESGSGLYAEDPEYGVAMLKYRQLSRDIRKLATQSFIEKYKRAPDPANTEDLLNLVKRGMDFAEEYSGRPDSDSY